MAGITALAGLGIITKVRIILGIAGMLAVGAAVVVVLRFIPLSEGNGGAFGTEMAVLMFIVAGLAMEIAAVRA